MMSATKAIWLPRGFSFLSGLPEQSRRRRLQMPVQAFIDDSGGKGHSRHFLLCGLVSNSERWAVFSDEWLKCLKTPPCIEYFKMKEAVGLSGQFQNWSSPVRDEKLRALARIINKHAEFVICCTIDLNAHADTWAKNLPKPMNEPYFWPFHVTTMGICLDLWDHGWREKFEIIFDEQVIFGSRAKSWYPIVKKVVQIREPEAHSIMPTDPIFRNDYEFLPIQAADLFAWCFRRNTDNPDERAFEWLLDEMQSVSESQYSQYYDFERMNSVFKESCRLIRLGLIPAELSNEQIKLFGP